MNLRINFIIVFLLGTFYLSAQSKKEGNLIPISVEVPESQYINSKESKTLLISRLDRALSANGVGGKDNYLAQFILYPSIDYVSEEMTDGAPTMHVCIIDVSFFVATKNKEHTFSSCTSTLKGVGNSAEKAMSNAFRSINGRNKDFSEMISEAKVKMLEFYESNCQNLIAEAKALAASGDYAEAISTLHSFPFFDSDCFYQSRELMEKFHSELEEKECALYINQAKVALANNQANKAAFFLLHISPLNSCEEDLKSTIQQLEELRNEIEVKNLTLLKEIHSNKKEIALKKIEARAKVAEAFLSYLTEARKKSDTKIIVIK